MQQFPPRAQQELQKVAGGQKPEKLYKEIYPDGTVLYEAEFQQHGREMEYLFTPGGFLVARQPESD
jgi:hypothetical protein